ncbi:MAG: MerR family transcriptional regulator [Paracoccus sp. (in: a-proteobacteria)]|uniref:MerR family transcriptional regulator n=1 Tax=Paracoccus sp. TaxID=267 RepID=UPI0039E4E5EF
MAAEVFESERIYDDADTELDLIAPRGKRAQWRHRRVGPNYLKMGRRVKYHGADLNAWIEANRVVTYPANAH